MIFCYVRVSTVEQSEKRQIVALKEKAHVEKFFVDKVSSKSAKRPKFDEMMNFLREGDELIASEFSRLARSTTGKYKGRNSKKRSEDFDFYKQGYYVQQSPLQR